MWVWIYYTSNTLLCSDFTNVWLNSDIHMPVIGSDPWLVSPWQWHSQTLVTHPCVTSLTDSDTHRHLWPIHVSCHPDSVSDTVSSVGQWHSHQYVSDTVSSVGQWHSHQYVSDTVISRSVTQSPVCQWHCVISRSVTLSPVCQWHGVTSSSVTLGVIGISVTLCCGVLTEVDVCGSNPCRHDGVCHQSNGTFTCNCTTGYTGPMCENGKTTAGPHHTMVTGCFNWQVV